jgi:hypothetical protein
MKAHSLFTFVFVCSVFLSMAQNVEPAPADKAVIYFVRPSSLGFAINFSYFDSTRLIGKFNGPSYIRYTCEPGRHLFWARSENRDFIEADVEAGKVYFIEAIVRMGAMKAAVALDPITDPKDPARMKKIIKLLERKSTEAFTPEELAAEEKEMADVIARGLEKYNDEKKEGKTFPRLEKAMAYGN